jgi:hypothetical protein
MNNESPQDRRMREIWQNQKTEGVRMSVAEVQASAGKFQRRIRNRNAREYVAAAVVVAFFGFEFWRAGDMLVRTGFALLIAGMVYVVWQLHARGSSKTLPRDAGLSSYVEFQRHELERQRDALERVRRWYLAPLVPGMAVLLMAFGLANPGHAKQIWLVVAIEALVLGAILFGIAKLNDAAARKLQDQIDELEDGGRQD